MRRTQCPADSADRADVAPAHPVPSCDQRHSDAVAAGGRWAEIHPAAVEDRLGPAAAYWVENDHNKIYALPQIARLPPIEDRLAQGAGKAEKWSRADLKNQGRPATNAGLFF